MIVNSNGILIYDNASVAQIFSFDHSGKYLRKISKYGHAKNEYDHILDFASNEKGDSIMILQYGQIKLFDDKGKLLSVYPIDDRYHWEHIEKCCNGGYVCASDYTNADDLISICDNAFNVTHNYVDTKGIEVKHGSYVWNPISSSHGKIVYCDFYFTSIYVTDTETYKTTCYKINTGNTAPIEKVKNGISNYDEFLDVQYDGEYIFGHLIHNKHQNRYKFDLKTNSFVIYGSVKDWFQEILAYHDGFYYGIIQPSELIPLLDEKPSYILENTYNAFRKALEPYAGDIDEMDNLYVIKMKKKSKK